MIRTFFVDKVDDDVGDDVPVALARCGMLDVDDASNDSTKRRRRARLSMSLLQLLAEVWMANSFFSPSSSIAAMVSVVLILLLLLPLAVRHRLSPRLSLQPRRQRPNVDLPNVGNDGE